MKSQEKQINKSVIDTWLRSLRIIKFDARNLYLETDDPLQREWFEEHIRSRVKKELRNNNNLPIEVHLIYKDKKELTLPKKTPPEPGSFSLDGLPLDSSYTFENLLFIEENKVPYQLLLEAAKGTEVLFNPIYLFGPSGSGKTHLLTAVAHQYRKQGKNSLYIEGKTFTKHVIGAIRLGSMQQLRNFYRTADALLLDDIDELAKKLATQEEFFHTFNALHTLGKQIIITAKKPPAQLQEIEPRLISRFSWGIELSLEKCQEHSLFTILEDRANKLNLPTSQELLKFLKETFPSNLTSQIQALEALSLRYKDKKTPSPASLKILLKDLIFQEEARRVSPDRIIEVTAQFFGLLPSDLLGKSQTQEHSFARQIAFYLCRNILQMPFAKIGDLFHKDHSTVMSSIKKIENYLGENHEKSCIAIAKITDSLTFATM